MNPLFAHLAYLRTATILVSQVTFPFLKTGGGAIVKISSVTGW